MYNKELKTRFIKDYTQSVNTAKVATNILAAMEPFEVAWKADLCTRNAEELQPAVDKVVALRFRSQWMPLSILKEYVKWCIAMQVPGACDGMLHITVAGLEKVRRQMVSSSFHLQQYLDEVFNDESDETIDNIYRCYYWMAYGGILERDILAVKIADVNFDQMCVQYGDTSVPIYHEALPALHNAVELTSFWYNYPRNSKPVRLDRTPGDTLIRGYQDITRIENFRANISHRSANATKQGKTEMQLSFSRVWMSGLFYRMYERERAGMPVDFTAVAAELMAGKTYVLNGRVKLEHRQKQRGRDYMEDYQRWKLAFFI